MAATAYLPLVLFPEHIRALAYGLPLLLALWHRNKWLLHGMAIAFSIISAIKLLFIVPTVEDHGIWFFWVSLGLKGVSIWVVALVVHALINTQSRLETSNQELERTNRELAASNQELMAREEEIARQNEELHAQAEELEQQTQELRQQSQEMEHQSSELHSLNSELARRERGLQSLLDSSRWVRENSSEDDVMSDICQAAGQALECACAAIVDNRDGKVHFCGHWRLDESEEMPPFCPVVCLTDRPERPDGVHSRLG